MEQISLLDFLTTATNCVYISDLRVEEKRKEILEVLQRTSSKIYTSKQWKDTYQYITGEVCSESDCEGIRQALIEYLG